MQNKFGENSVWVYEILRQDLYTVFNHVSEADSLTEGLTEVKVFFVQFQIQEVFLVIFITVKDKGTALAKSMLASKNLPKPITKASEGKHWIRVLAAELALRLKDAREISPNLWPKTIVLHARKGAKVLKNDTPFD